MKRLLIAALLLSVCTACSLKDDRDDCPCYVSVRTETDRDCLVSFYDGSGTLVARRELTRDELLTGENYTRVKKGDIYVNILKNHDNMILSGGRQVQCQNGLESDRMYACTISDRAEDDNLLVTGALQKQHAQVTLQFISHVTPYPYEVMVYGNSNGMDLISLEAVPGSFALLPRIDASLESVFVMSRQQAEGDITLYILEKATGMAAAKLDLGRYIASTGYNWDAEYLGDIRVVVDYARLTISITVEDWGEGKTFSFTI